MIDTLSFMASITPELVEGLWLTLELSLISFLIGMLISVLLTPPRIFKIPLLGSLATTYVEVFRGTPLFVQILLIYFGLPSLNIKFDAITAGIIALGLNSAAYQAEILRSSILAIPKEQYYAGLSLGMTKLQVYVHIILPQALRCAIPALMNELVTLVKESSLVSVIGVAELTMRGRRIAAQSFRALEAYIMVAIIYLVVCTVLTRVAKLVERKVMIPGYGVR